MSEQEVHVGELFEVPIFLFNFKEGADLYKPIWDYETSFAPLEKYHSDYEDAVRDKFGDKYNVMDKDVVLVMYYSRQLDYYGFAEMRQCAINEGRVLQFSVSFHNGGTYLSEVLRDAYRDYRSKWKNRYSDNDEIHEARKNISSMHEELCMMFEYYAHHGDNYQEVMTTIAKSGQSWRLKWFERLITSE